LQKQSSSEFEPIGLLIAAARRRIRQAVGSRARAHGLTTQQFWVVNAIVEAAGLSLRELAARLRMDEPTASRIVAGLVAQGWIRSEDDPRDRRRSCLLPGERASDGTRKIAALANEIRGAMVEGLRPADQRALRALLRRIIANMDRLVEGEPPNGKAQRGVGQRKSATRAAARETTRAAARTAT
jgi:DNA-binding MarR family transcriptional regulator